jgi:glycosyltransferase involved in cell wall biosynthesis
MAAEVERSGTVAIVHPPGYVGINPTIESMISFLAERGHDVHLISLNRPRDDAAGFTSHALRAKHPWLAARWGRPLSRFWMPVFVWLEVRRTRAGVVIAVDAAGALATAVNVWFARALHVYLSLHMESLADVVRRRRYGAAVRRLVERRILRRMDAVITQDDYRRRQLQEENGVEGDSIPCFLVPNSHRGRAHRHASTFYQDKLGLPLDEPVVLVAGDIGVEWSHTEFLAECAASQNPPFYTLVMQSREPLAGSALRKLSALCHSRAVLSPEPVPAGELGSAFGSATVGAAIYTNTFHWNQTFVGGASGKMMSYLQAGVPVIMHDSPGVTEVIREFDCGEVLSGLDCDEFNDLVRKIASAHRHYSVNAERCFNEKYEFDQAFSAVYRFMTCQDDLRPRA